jgi:hypothetical protein
VSIGKLEFDFFHDGIGMDEHPSVIHLLEFPAATLAARHLKVAADRLGFAAQANRSTNACQDTSVFTVCNSSATVNGFGSAAENPRGALDPPKEAETYSTGKSGMLLLKASARAIPFIWGMEISVRRRRNWV